MSKVYKKNQSGMSLVEVIIASTIVLSLSLILLTVNVTYFNTSKTNLKTIKATYLIEQAIESVNFLANNNWNNLGALETNYYLLWSGTNWNTTTTKILVDQFYDLSFFTSAVNRDSNSDIVTSGGTPDTNTRKLTVQVVWSDSKGTTTKSMSSYLMKHDE